MPADPFEELGLTPAADDAEIRRRYLELTVRFQPEQHPERFAAVRAAYEKIRTLPARAAYVLFEQGREASIDSILDDLCREEARPRPPLAALRKWLPTK